MTNPSNVINRGPQYVGLFDVEISELIKVPVTKSIPIDEIQEVHEWERAVRSFMVDFDYDIYLTGSNAHLLSGELATYLTGRYVELELFPLSFNEYIDFIRSIK